MFPSAIPLADRGRIRTHEAGSERVQTGRAWRTFQAVPGNLPLSRSFSLASTAYAEAACSLGVSPTLNLTYTPAPAACHPSMAGPPCLYPPVRAPVVP